MTSRANAWHWSRKAICSSVSRNSTVLRLRCRLTGRSIVKQTQAFSRDTRRSGACTGAMVRRPPMRRTRLLPLLVVVAATAAGCGGKAATTPDKPKLGAKGTDTQAAQGLGFPAIATKNTTRVGGADPVADAAGVAQAVFPGTDNASRPQAVTLVDSSDWRAG